MFKFKRKNKINNKNTSNVVRKEEKIKKETIKSENKINLKNIFKYILSFIKKYWKIIVSIILVIFIAIISICVHNYFYEKKYRPYEIKMHNYGFDKMYNNGTALSYEKVTKSEAIKLILASIYNIYDANEINFDNTDTSYQNAIWVDYAVKQKIISNDQINSKNEDTNISYLDAIKYYINARAKLLNEPIKSDSEASFKDLKKYSSDMQLYINDAVYNKLIDNTTSSLNAKRDITKAQMNQLLINFVENYNTITVKGDKININPDKQPTNAQVYPYILSNVDKYTYQKPLLYNENNATLNPIDTYIMNKEYYSQIKEFTEIYYNTILNIDYNTITTDYLRNNLRNYVMFGISDEDISNYVDYVKKHALKITGTAKIQLPIIYFDGIDYRARLKLDFNVENGDTKTNIFFMDLNEENPCDYSDKKELIIDARLGHVFQQNSLYIYPTSVSSLIVK